MNMQFSDYLKLKCSPDTQAFKTKQLHYYNYFQLDALVTKDILINALPLPS